MTDDVIAQTNPKKKRAQNIALVPSTERYAPPRPDSMSTEQEPSTLRKRLTQRRREQEQDRKGDRLMPTPREGSPPTSPAEHTMVRTDMQEAAPLEDVTDEVMDTVSSMIKQAIDPLEARIAELERRLDEHVASF